MTLVKAIEELLARQAGVQTTMCDFKTKKGDDLKNGKLRGSPEEGRAVRYVRAGNGLDGGKSEDELPS